MDQSMREPEEIWPNWRDGVPTEFNRLVFGERFFKDGALQPDIYYYVPLKLRWHSPLSLSTLSKNKHWLPDRHASEWTGVYRIFCANAAIGRSCGKDETGTLYFGMAGAGIRKGSVLRSRISLQRLARQ